MNEQDTDLQPFHVFLCHNSEDNSAVKAVADQLKQRGYRPWLDEWELQPGKPWQRVLEAQIKAVGSAAVFVGSSGMGPWQNIELDAFIRQFVKRECPVIPVLLPNAPEEPELPVMLDGMTYVDFRKKGGDQSPLDRLIWGITGVKPGGRQAEGHTSSPKPQSPDPPELFVGRRQPLEQLMSGLDGDGTAAVVTGRLYNVEGAGGIGKTWLAREAGRRLRDRFPQGVMEVAVDGLDPVAFAVELARRLEVAVDEPRSPQEARNLVSHLLKDRRMLLILDNLVDPAAAPHYLPQNTQTSVVITTRSKDCYQVLRLKRRDLELSRISLERFSPEESLELFREMLADAYNPAMEGLYGEIADALGHLPVALRPVLNLMVFSPCYQPGQLLEKLRSPELGALLKQGAEQDQDLRTVQTVFRLDGEWLAMQPHRRVLERLACCAPGPVPLDFLERFCQEPDLARILEDLRARSWCDRRESETGRTYALHDLVRAVVRDHWDADPWDGFVDLVDRAYREEHFLVKDRWLPQFRQALALCDQHRDRRQIGWINEYFWSYCDRRGHGALFVALADQVARLFPEDSVLAVVANQKARMLSNWGRLDEAFELYEQAIGLLDEMDDKQNLAACYGNQAVILKAWGKLEDAHALHKKEEALCETLGDRAGLAACYGNQALILKAWGKLEDADALYKKVEAMFEALGDRAGLARCYGHQALILHAWGKLEEAHALHKKEEAIKEALGDRAGLANCYGNQALILNAWGKLEDAHGLYKKAEALFEALGDRAGQAVCYWNQGDLLRKQGDRSGQESLWRRALALYRELGLPTDFMEHHLKQLTEEDSSQ